MFGNNKKAYIKVIVYINKECYNVVEILKINRNLLCNFFYIWIFSIILFPK